MKSKAELASALALWDDANEQMAGLTSKQRQILNQMTDENLFGTASSLVSSNELLDVNDDKSSARSGNKGKSNMSDSIKTSATDLKLDSGRDFLDWLDRMETNIQTQKNSHFNLYYERVSDLNESTQGLLGQVDKTLEILDFLKEQNVSASTKSNNLHSVCNDLMTQMSLLNELKTELEGKETVFKTTDKFSVAHHGSHFNIENFPKFLDEIETCLAFFDSHPTYKDSSKYQVKCKAAAAKILIFLKDSFRNTLERNLESLTSSASKSQDTTSFDMFYGRLKMTAPRFQPIFMHLFNKIKEEGDKVSPLKDEFEATMQECLSIFVSSRHQLVVQSLNFTLEDSIKKFERDHCSLVRSASVSLFHLLRDEESLMREFFQLYENSQLEDYFNSICMIFYDFLRPKIVKLHHLETLSEISSILKLELLMDHQQESNSTSQKSFKSSMTQMWEDVQERLVYRAYIFIKTDINDFNPHEGDLLYPEKLQMMLEIANQDPALKDSPADIHGMWYPTVRRTLLCLSKLYRSVEKDIFQEVAHEALKACIASIVHASNMIQSRKSKFDGQLFLIKHLLILREQITPFNIVHSSMETSLDFSHYYRDSLSLDRLVRNALPEVREFHMDYRREVDRLLKLTCEEYIQEASNSVIGPLSTCIISKEALKKMAATNLNEKVMEAQKNMKKVIPLIHQKMSLYLANKETEFILYKPIRVNILETFSKFLKMTEETFDEQDLVVIGCPSIEILTVTLSSFSITK